MDIYILSGLWYARQSREKQDKSEKNLPSISMNANQVHNVGRTLDSLDGGGRSAVGQEQSPSWDGHLGQEWDQRLSSIRKLHFDEGECFENLWLHNYYQL